VVRSRPRLLFAHYNFCRPHTSLNKCTPAMERGLANHLWTIQELTASSSAAAPQPNRNVSRKGAKAAKKQALSFRPTGEIFPRSLAFCSGSQARHFAFLASWRESANNPDLGEAVEEIE